VPAVGDIRDYSWLNPRRNTAWRGLKAALDLYALDGCDDGECKEAINHLIRAHGRFFCHPTPNAHSRKAIAAKKGTEFRVDHVVPVVEVMEALMRRAKYRREPSLKAIVAHLDRHLLTCRIILHEDDHLRQAKLWHCMPEGGVNNHVRILDLWTRYSPPASRSNGFPPEPCPPAGCCYAGLAPDRFTAHIVSGSSLVQI
jgi:hypothetical protein